MEMQEPAGNLHLNGLEVEAAAVTPEAALTMIQELADGNVNMVPNAEEDEDHNNSSKEDGDMEQKADDDDYFFPTPEEVEQARAPEVGMTFATVHEARRFLSIYGQVVGFAVTVGSNYKRKKFTLQCNRSRKMKEVDESKRQRKRKKDLIERTDCKMKMLIKLVDGQWRVANVDNEHNHPLAVSPPLVRFFLSHKYMSDEERSFSRVLQESRIKPTKIMEIFEKLGGRFKNNPRRKMDTNNLMLADGRGANNFEIESALKHVIRLQKERPGFYYMVKTNGYNTVRSIFWTDARARLDYALYGDHVSLDTSYGTNKFNVPFALITGVNGHGKKIAFGWALLEDEETSTFSWLFKTFLDVMGGKKPSVITTCQAPTISESIALVFPTVSHRFCMWCVMREAKEPLGGFTVRRPGMEAELTRLVTNSLTTEEFESGWQSMVEKHAAASDAHVQLMYETRSMWMPLYFKHVFCPFIRSTGCNESANSNFKDHVPEINSIEALIHQYEIFQEEIVSSQGVDKSRSTPGKLTYVTRQPIERHASAIYTMGMFQKFQKELYDSTAFIVEQKEMDRIYITKKVMDYEEAEFQRDSFSVEVDRKSNVFKCICSKFERDGMLCCHVLRIFTHFGVNEIPEHYILKRWTKKFREEELNKHLHSTMEKVDGSQNALRYAMVMNRLADIAATVCKDGTEAAKFLESLDRIAREDGDNT